MTQILRLPEVKHITGYAKSTIYFYIDSGLFPKPVKIGPRSVGWPSDEVLCLLRARIAGKSDAEIEGLVKEIEKNRVVNRF